MTDTSVQRNEAANRFEIVADGETAVLDYRLQPDTITFVHTGVPPKLEGRGLAKRLAVAGLAFARDNGLSVVPLCPFVASYIKRHPNELDIVREDYRDRLRR